MKGFILLLLLLTVSLVMSAGLPRHGNNIDYLEALRRMQQVPQWHCMRYRRFHPHGHCSRWWLTRRA
ncbi:unnamed protein product [Leptosia nina]|uniref:Apelin n=1 Tax=Leptosia nina TaxID=320188 RepID=A0AAV1JP17_9NEOP